MLLTTSRKRHQTLYKMMSAWKRVSRSFLLLVSLLAILQRPHSRCGAQEVIPIGKAHFSLLFFFHFFFFSLFLYFLPFAIVCVFTSEVSCVIFSPHTFIIYFLTALRDAFIFLASDGKLYFISFYFAHSLLLCFWWKLLLLPPPQSLYNADHI